MFIPDFSRKCHWIKIPTMGFRLGLRPVVSDFGENKLKPDYPEIDHENVFI